MPARPWTPATTASNERRLTSLVWTCRVTASPSCTPAKSVLGSRAHPSPWRRWSTLFGGVQDGEAVTRHVHTREVRRRSFDAVVAGVHGRADTSLAGAVERAGRKLLVAGDAVAPRTALHAYREGDDAGRAA